MVGEVTYLLLGMAHAIDLSNLSLEELYVLAGRVQCRIKTLSASTATAEQTTTTAYADPWASTQDAGPDPSRPGIASGAQSETRATPSEKVQDLINTNDPWEGSGVGPTRWSTFLWRAYYSHPWKCGMLASSATWACNLAGLWGATMLRY